MSSIIGNKLKISIFGQSHSEGIGVVIDGLPAGFEPDLAQLSAFMARRAPGGGSYATARKEADEPKFLSGLFGGKTCGAPLCAVIENKNTRSKDYDNLKITPRPGHADFTAEVKYGGFQDFTGGGHFSGRLTAPLCIAGGIALQILKEKGIKITAHIKSIKDAEDSSFDFKNIETPENDKFSVLCPEKGEKMLAVIEEAKSRGDSVGGVIECAIEGVAPGIGEPMFGGVENNISKIVFGIPAVKGIEFGAGFAAAQLFGSENNDPYEVCDGVVTTKTNHSGGILGGITSGMPIIFRVAIKPTPSIGTEQESVNLKTMQNEKVTVHGRHDPCIVPRAVPCIEAATAIAILDMLL